MLTKLMLSAAITLSIAVLVLSFDIQSIADSQSDQAAATANTLRNAKLFISPKHHGEATYYRATGKGNCSFPPSSDLMVTAVNNDDYAHAELCGAYLNVTGPNGSVTVRVVDRCPSCKTNGLDLSQQAFMRIAEKKSGRIRVTWQVVAGPVTRPVVYHYMRGSTRYWIGIQVRNHRLPIKSLEILPHGSSGWLKAERRSYNYFIYPKPIAAGYLKVRITAVTGDVIEDQLPEPGSNITVHGSSQF